MARLKSQGKLVPDRVQVKLHELQNAAKAFTASVPNAYVNQATDAMRVTVYPCNGGASSRCANEPYTPLLVLTAVNWTETRPRFRAIVFRAPAFRPVPRPLEAPPWLLLEVRLPSTEIVSNKDENRSIHVLPTDHSRRRTRDSRAPVPQQRSFMSTGQRPYLRSWRRATLQARSRQLTQTQSGATHRRPPLNGLITSRGSVSGAEHPFC